MKKLKKELQTTIAFAFIDGKAHQVVISGSQLTALLEGWFKSEGKNSIQVSQEVLEGLYISDPEPLPNNQMNAIESLMVELNRISSREYHKEKGIRYAPVFVPKERTLTKAQWKFIDSTMRMTYRENEHKIRGAVLEKLLYGTPVPYEVGKHVQKNFWKLI